MQQKPFFLAAMHELGVPMHSPGVILAITILIRHAMLTASDIVDACVTHSKDSEAIRTLVDRLHMLGNKLFTVFMRMTGSDYGWIDGLEHPKYNIIFDALHVAHGHACALYENFVTRQGKGMLNDLLGGAYVVQHRLGEITRLTPIKMDYNESAIDMLPDFKIPSTPDRKLEASYETLDILITRFRTASAKHKLIDRPRPVDQIRARYYAVLDWFIERILLPLDEVRDHGEVRSIEYKNRLVQEVEVAIHKLDEVVQKAVSEAAKKWTEYTERRMRTSNEFTTWHSVFTHRSSRFSRSSHMQ